MKTMIYVSYIILPFKLFDRDCTNVVYPEDRGAGSTCYTAFPRPDDKACKVIRTLERNASLGAVRIVDELGERNGDRNPLAGGVE